MALVTYGMDVNGERSLPLLLQDLDQVDDVEWIRLMYAYPAKFPLELLDVYRQSSKLCRYLDIPVQHASDDVLKSMRRGMSNRTLRELLQRIKTTVPNMALRTTLIVGYPNETEKDFEMLCDFVKETRFHRLGVFTYSQEEGTTAHELGDPIPATVKEERRAVIMQIQQEISAQRNKDMVGQEVKVLLERRDGEFIVGRTEWDAPEIDQEVYVNRTDHLMPGNFCTARIVDTTEYDVYAIAS